MSVIAQTDISRIERDETTDPGVHRVAMIAIALGVPIESLLSEEGPFASRINDARRKAENRRPSVEPAATASSHPATPLFDNPWPAIRQIAKILGELGRPEMMASLQDAAQDERQRDRISKRARPKGRETA